ncbi:MAG: helix-turn-helix domain-containing protein [Streptosporangiaceae bacterium]
MATATLLTVREVADILSIHPRTLMRWRREGHGPFGFKIDSGALRYPEPDFQEYLMTCAAKGIEEERARRGKS